MMAFRFEKSPLIKCAGEHIMELIRTTERNDSMETTGAASRRYGCPHCGGGLRYDIPSRGMRCDRCGEVTELAKLPPEPAADTLEVTEFHCPQCGAAVYSTDTEVTSFCSFCGSDVVLTGKLARTKRPAKIVPFSVTREDCEAAYRGHLKKFLLAPSDLKKAETISHFRPVYVPFWSYSVAAEGPVRLEGRKSYTKGNYRYDETYDLSMDARIRQQGILYDASTAFEDETAALLSHTADQAIPFHPAFLSGFFAQGADVPAETYEEEAAATAVRMFMDQVKEENKMDSVKMKGEAEGHLGLPDARFEQELVMLPVWLLAHRQGFRVVYTAVNGQSGHVVCDVPVSSGRVAGVVLAFAAVLFAVLHTFLTLKPDLLMLLCAALSVLTQFQFSGTQELLYTRRTRAWDPDPQNADKPFVGPAQAMLKGTGGALSFLKGSVPKQAGAVIGSSSVLFACAAVFLSYITAEGAASQRSLVTIALLIATVVMAVHTARHLNREKNGPWWPRLLCFLACAAGLLCLVTGQVEDMIYYACSAAMLLASAIELIIMNRSHNEYASRPVPFFGEKEEETV